MELQVSTTDSLNQLIQYMLLRFKKTEQHSSIDEFSETLITYYSTFLMMNSNNIKYLILNQ